MYRRRRLNPTEDQERRAAAVMLDPDLDFDMAIDLANRILAGEEVAEALAGTGLVVDMSPQPAQIAEIETSRGVVEVPVVDASSQPISADLISPPSFDDAVQMNSKTFRAAAIDACMKRHGEAFNEEVFKSALEKAKRHMKNKYGSLDYEAEYAESGVDSVVFFYRESAKGVQQTWNGAKAAKPVWSR